MKTVSAATVLSLSWLAHSATALPSSSVAVSATSTSVVPTATATSGFRSVAYFADWDIYSSINFFPQNITASTLSHLIYCFANVNSTTGSVGLSDVWADLQFPYPGDNSSDTSAVAGNVKQLYLMKQQNRNLKTLLSIGGATYSTNFANFTLTQEGRQTFAQSAVELVQNLGFDGIDIDWEYPTDQAHAEAFTRLLEEVRTALDNYSDQWANNTNLLLSVAAPAGASSYQVMDLAGMDKYLDMWNLMAYDYAGSWSDNSGDLANVYASKSDPNSTPTNTDDAITYYLSQGISASKINLGMPIYARTFPDTTGLGQPFNKTAAAEVNYNAIDTTNANITELTDVLASYSYNSSSDGTLYSFDTPNIAKLKTEYAQSKGLGGAMFWEISGDKVGEESIIGTVVNAVGGSTALDQSQNLLSYPNSNYTNLRNQMGN
ncbi:chitinase [Talaromyces proteolyticus]|uniref:chitinase n=1 Tax=Talaromyces proteolyticus TaxID=1131652 RepID=A0AAD4KGF8_9EURO|nr:chitinase [Talaromyces proteolyticus]KAH8690528.1 chitinase [Talaromyces proteolyticus]